jgi:multidrug efflux pump subunit AcrA (membrane-fusion protein)
VEDTRRFRLEVRVDESRIGWVSPGVTVAVAVDAGSDDAARVIDGTVAEVSRAVDAGVRTFLVKIALPDHPGLRSGMFGRARFNTQPRRALTVPEAALVHRGQVTSVFVVERDLARVRLVNVRGIEVLAGLSEGDVVIVTPPPTLADGRRVTVGDR